MTDPQQPLQPTPEPMVRPASPQAAVGTVALLTALVALVVSLVTMIALRVLLFSEIGPSGYQAIGLVGEVFSFLIAATALVLGAFGLRRGRAGRARSGVAVGIGAALVAAQLVGVILNLATTALYGF